MMLSVVDEVESIALASVVDEDTQEAFESLVRALLHSKLSTGWTVTWSWKRETSLVIIEVYLVVVGGDPAVLDRWAAVPND